MAAAASPRPDSIVCRLVKRAGLLPVKCVGDAACASAGTELVSIGRLRIARRCHWKSMSEMKRHAPGSERISLGDEIVGRINQLGGDLRDAGASGADLPHPRASRGRRSDPGLDARGRHGRASRCDRQCLRPLRRRAAGLAVPDAGLALRHRARCRQMGRPARADHGDFLRRRSEPARAAVAVRDRGHRLRRRGGRALRLDAARQPRGRRHLRRERARRAATAPASRCARR